MLQTAGLGANEHAFPQDPSKKFKGDVMDLRLDIERRKRFAGKEPRREGDRSPGGSRGASREKSSEKSGKHHKKSKYVQSAASIRPLQSQRGHREHEVTVGAVLPCSGTLPPPRRPLYSTLYNLPKVC